MECESACLSFTIDLHDPLAYTVYIYIYLFNNMHTCDKGLHVAGQ